VVGAFLWEGRAIVGGPVVLAGLLVFLPFLTTVVHKGAGAGGRRVASRGFESGLTSRGFVSATLKGIGVGVSGQGVSAFKATISSVRMSTLSTNASTADL